MCGDTGSEGQPTLWKTMAWSADVLRAGSNTTSVVGAWIGMAEGCKPRACARVTGLITVHLDPVHFTPREGLSFATLVGIVNARRAFLCRTDRRTPWAASKKVLPVQGLGQSWWGCFARNQSSPTQDERTSPVAVHVGSLCDGIWPCVLSLPFARSDSRPSLLSRVEAP